MRKYLNLAARQTSAEVAADSFRDQILVAVALVTLVMGLRVNRRSRLAFEEAQDADATPSRPWWLELLIMVVWNFCRVSLTQGTF